jgi:hypothetical protein
MLLHLVKMHLHCKSHVGAFLHCTTPAAAPPEYAAYAQTLVDLQALFQLPPTFSHFRPWMGSPSQLPLPKNYTTELEDFARQPYLAFPSRKVYEGGALDIQKKRYVVRKLWVDRPEEGCIGLVLKCGKELIVAFKSATHVSTFVKIGASSMLQHPKTLTPGVRCNSYLANYYNKHFSAPLAAALSAEPADAKVVFLGYSMGAALGQLALYDLRVRRGKVFQQAHLFMASPRVATRKFYEQLDKRGIEITNMIAATRYKDSIYMDPVALLKGFDNPHTTLVFGQLEAVGASWQEGLFPTPGTPLVVVRGTADFHAQFQCHPLSIMGSYLRTAFGESSMDLHGCYNGLVRNGVFL